MGASIYDLSTTPGSNTIVDGISQAENVMVPSSVNDAFRALDAILARWANDRGAVNTVGGTGDAVTVTLSSGITAYATGQTFRFIAGAANTGAATMNVNSIGIKAIRKISGGTDVALSAGDIAAGETYLVRYSASANAAAGAWIIVGAAAVAAATTSAAGIVELATAAEAMTNDAARAIVPATASQAFGGCVLTKSSTNLLLSRQSGPKLFINGVFEAVPIAGVTLSTSGLSTNTTYFIYAYMNSGTMTLEASTTAHAADATYGHRIKSGDSTRSLVGMARTNGSTAWVDSASQRFTRSWFNRPGVQLQNSFTTSRSTSSTSFVEVNSEIRVEFLIWSDEVINLSGAGTVYTNAGPNYSSTAIGIDGTSTMIGRIDSYGTSSVLFPWGTGGTAALSEGYHYATIVAAAITSNSVQYGGNTGVAPINYGTLYGSI